MSMKKHISKARHYLKFAALFGVIGWTLFFVAGFFAAFGHDQYAIYTGAASIFVGWFISGYFWLRYGLVQGKSVKEIILSRIKR